MVNCYDKAHITTYNYWSLRFTKNSEANGSEFFKNCFDEYITSDVCVHAHSINP